MKKIFFLSMVVLIFLPTLAHGASIGGAETQGQGRLGVGVDSSFIFERKLNFKSSSGLLVGDEIKNAKINKTYQATVKASYGLLDNLEAYLKLGVADYTLKDEIYNGGVKTATDKFNTDLGVTYGLGLKGVYRFNKNNYRGYWFKSDWLNDWMVGCDLQYLRSQSKAKLNEEGNSTKYKSFVVQEWHIAPYLAKKINNFTPYFGIRYSDMRTTIKEPKDSGWADNNKYEADKNFGIFLGTDYLAGESINLNFEGRFLDETAGSFAVNWVF
ncbi:MAG: hypothetical protein NC818_05175 [Candidatus Omnitrophica bacterium]|nr:hypothetical protein [Candidatus Omnitrophota bacterium]